VEGLASGAELHPLQAAFADLGAAQYATEHLAVAAKRIEGSAGAVKIPHVSPTVQDEKGLALLPSP
jgi:hypothetical protein